MKLFKSYSITKKKLKCGKFPKKCNYVLRKKGPYAGFKHKIKLK